MDRHIEAFLEMMAAERGAAANTLAAYRRDLEDFAARSATVARADAGAVSAYLRGLAKAGLSPRTQARRLSSLRQFFRFLLSEGIRADDPTADSDAPKLGKPLPKYLSEAEVESLLAAAEKPIEKAGLEILYATGLRICEMLALPAQALSTDAAIVLIRGKGGRERIVPLSESAKSAAAALRAAAPKGARYLFPGRAAGAALTRQAFNLILKRVALRANLDPARVSPHVLRHSFASHLLARGADLRSLQTLLGHADIATTEIYTHVLAERLQRLVEAHHPLAAPGGKKPSC